MNEVPDTELISAYLDGELTADEQFRVEKMLAVSPEARQLFEELRALGTTLQNLPQQKLDEDFSLRVLETAERRMLTASDSKGDAREQDRAKPAAGRAAETLKPWWRGISWHGMLSRRALVWSGIVVVAALMLHFMSQPEHRVPERIAMTVEDKTDPPKSAAAPGGERAAAPHGISGGGWRNSDEGRRGPDDNQATAGAPAKDASAKEEAVRALGDEAKRPESLVHEDFGRKGGEKSDDVGITQNLDGKNRGLGRDEDGTDGPGAPSVADSLTMNKKLAEAKPEAAAVPATTTASPFPANEPALGSAPVAGVRSTGIVAKSDSAPRDETVREKAEAEARKDGHNFANAAGGRGGNRVQNGQVGENSPPVLVVSLDISLTAARQKTFESLLKRLDMVDMQDPVAARRGHSGGYVQQNSLRAATPRGTANRQTDSLNIGQDQENLALQSATGDAFNSEAPTTEGQRLSAPKKAADNDRPGANAQQRPGGQIIGNVPRAGSPRQIVYDVDATSAQVFEVLLQIAQKREVFSPPMIQSTARANDNNEVTPSKPADPARQQVVEATKAAADATNEQGEKEESLYAAKPRPAKSGVGTFAMQRKPAERQEAKQAPAVATRRVRFALQVVDPWPKARASAVELAPADPAPAVLPAAPAKQ